MADESKTPKPPSEDFVAVVATGGGIVADCELCGRTLFEDDELAGDWEDGELERLRERAEKDPDKCIGFADQSVSTGYIGGKYVVTNCPCNGLRHYEDFIWSHRRLIADYIERRAKRIAEAAYDDEARAEFLKENVEDRDQDISFAKCQDCGGYFDREVFDERTYCPRCADMHPAETKDESTDDAFNWDEDDNLPF